MKKSLLLALAGLLAAVAPALAYPPAAANVNFASERGVPFGLVLDGRPLTRGVARQVHVDRLVPGQHWADFTLPTAFGGVTRFRSRIWLEPGIETTFVLVARPGQPLGLQQVQAVALYGPGYPGGGGGRYNSPAPYGQGGGSYYQNDPYGGGQGTYGNYPSTPNSSYPNAPNGNYPNGNYPNNGGQGNYPGNGNGYPNNGGNGNYPSNGYPNNPNNGGTPSGGGYYPGSVTSSYRSLAPQDVNALVQTMQQRITEVSKLNAAKEGLTERSLQTDDLARLLRGLTSEACRIDLAKFALGHVSDPENFGRVYDAFETEAGAQAVEQAAREAQQQQR